MSSGAPTEIELTDPSLVVLAGTSGSGKSTFAAAHFAATEVLASDRFRAMITDDEGDQRVSGHAFELLHAVAEKRLLHGKLTVVDATNVEREPRRALVAIARSQHLPVDAVVLDLPIEECIARDAARPGRSVGERVVREQRAQLDESLRSLASEGFRRVIRLEGARAIDAARFVRRPLDCDRRELTGPFDLVGDVHGCLDELEALLAALGYTPEGAHPDGRRLILLGDVVDRGPKIAGVLRLVMRAVRAHGALCVIGNHEAKVLRWLDGGTPGKGRGLAATIAELEREPEGFRREVQGFLRALPDHLVLDGGALVAAHAGLIERLHGRTGKRVRAFCLYGDTTGETDAEGFPIRRDWAAGYAGSAAVVYGHTPVPAAEWRNGTICLDTGCVFGGRLTALRWPERELVAVPATRAWFEYRSA
ncbi:MAG: AAA family ATPase [Sandaracinaceae bacterium]|nr:AAA family ATPase [Sandaracinaceae bacterium]